MKDYYYYRYSALGPVWAETRAQSGDWYGSGSCILGKFLGVVCHCFLPYERYRIQICVYFGLQYLFQRQMEACPNTLNPDICQCMSIYLRIYHGSLFGQFSTLLYLLYEGHEFETERVGTSHFK